MEDINIRLIDVKTLTLQKFLFDPHRVPRYAILSQTWGDSEVTFRQWNQWVQDHTSTSQHEGLEKIRLACTEARRLGYRYLWADTCCIKDNDDEEKHGCIDSMFEFYESSDVCLAYLSDLKPHHETPNMRRCRWFRRGWTLQELVAPRNLRFYDRGWRFRGTKDELCRLVSSITGISGDVLTHNRPLHEVPTAEKNSWIQGRRTTHHIDQYYCLLGLFGLKRNRKAGNSLSPLGDPVRRLQDSVRTFETGYQPQVQEYDDGYGVTVQSSFDSPDYGGKPVDHTGQWKYPHLATDAGSTSGWANGTDSASAMTMDSTPVPPLVTPNRANSLADHFESTGRSGSSRGSCTISTRNTLAAGDSPCAYQDYVASPHSTLNHYAPVQVPISFASTGVVPPAGTLFQDRSTRNGKKARQIHQRQTNEARRQNHTETTHTREPAGSHSTYHDLSETTTPVAYAEPRNYTAYSSAPFQASQSPSKVYTGQTELQLIPQDKNNAVSISFDPTYYPVSRGDLIYDYKNPIPEESFNNGYWIGTRSSRGQVTDEKPRHSTHQMEDITALPAAYPPPAQPWIPTDMIY